jgi:glutamine amidotransferase
MKVGIVSYGMGNLGSVRRALEDLGVAPFVAEHPAALFEANRIVLPGVGAFAEGMAHLRAAGWVDALRHQVREGGKPLLGICLGMQLLADDGDEGGATAGLALVPGRVRRLDALGCTLRIPHVGWNEVAFAPEDPLFRGVAQQTDFYFVHSYAFAPTRAGDVSGTTEYGVRVAAAVRAGNVFGVQFHPEKSSRAGRLLLRNFLEYVPC